MQDNQELKQFIDSLKPIDIEDSPEVYLGLRELDNSFEGSRIFFESEQCIFNIYQGNYHQKNQLWKIKKAKGHPKGVHTIMTVETQLYTTFIE